MATGPIIFPDNPVEDTVWTDQYGRVWIYKSDSWVSKNAAFGPAVVNLKLETYDLAINDTQGGDLKASQVYKVDNTDATAKSIAFTNPPADRAQTVVVIINGNAGAVSLPEGTVFAENVDVTLGATKTIFVLLWDGDNFTATTNIKV